MIKMQQGQIPHPPVVSISMISTAWRKSHIRCNSFQLLHSFSLLCLRWILEVLAVMPAPHMFQYVHHLLLNYIAYCKWFPLLFTHISPFSEKLHSVHNITWSTKVIYDSKLNTQSGTSSYNKSLSTKVCGQWTEISYLFPLNPLSSLQ